MEDHREETVPELGNPQNAVTQPAQPAALAAEEYPRPFGERYTLERELARGGMGRVYVGTDRKLGRQVAIKVMSGAAHDEDGLRRFEQEARTTGALHHANMVAVFDAGQHEGRPYIVMELLQGQTLRQLLKAGPLPVRSALDYAQQLARGLQAAHDKGVVHRDIKPDNLFVTADGPLKILDFGVVKLMGELVEGGEAFATPQGGVARSPRTQTGAVVGTVGYMAPEQVRGQPIDHRADLFSFGAVLFEMLAGHRAFLGASAVETAYSILTADPQPLPPNVPYALRRLVSRCLRKKREERPPSARELGLELETMLERTPTLPTLRLTGHALALYEGRRRWLLPVLIALAALVAGTALWMGGARFSMGRKAVPGKVRVIAVLPFVVRGGATYGYLGEGMVDLLSTNLTGAGALRAVDPSAIIPAALREKGALDPPRAAAIARRFGAGLFVLGSVLEVEKRLRVQASLYDAEEGGPPLAEARVEGHSSQLFHLVDQITAQLRTHLGESATPVQGPGGRLARLAQMTTHSPEALKHYLEAESALRRSSFHGAREALQKAVAVDPEFALAHYRLAIAASISHPQLADDSLKNALRGSARLSVRDRLLVEAYAAFREGRVEDAERQYRALVRDNPDEVEAFWQLGELRFHFNPLRGKPVSDAAEPFGRVLVLDPGHGGALSHSVDLALLAGDRQIALALADRFLANAGDAPGLQFAMRWVRAWAAGDDAATAALLEELRRSESREDIQQSLHRALWQGDDLRSARTLAGMLAELGTPAERADGLESLAALDVAQGLRRAAREKLSKAAQLDPNFVYAYDALWVDTLDFLPVPADELARDRAGAQVLDTPKRAALPIMRGYVQAALALKAGDEAAALASADALDQLKAQGGVSAAQDFALALRSRIAARAGRHAEALALLEQMPLRVPYPYHGSLSRLAEQLPRAELLAEAGRLDEALHWADSFAFFHRWEPAYLAPSLLLRARILEKMGKTRLAAESYRRYVELRGSCDAELRPELQEAQRHLARLSPTPAR